MNKNELRALIDSFFKDEMKLQEKGNNWANDNGFAKLLFNVESARFMDCFYINVGIYYNDLGATHSKKIPTFHNWHLGADIGYILKNAPVLVDYCINNEALNVVFGKIRDIVIPFAEKWRTKEYLRTYPDIIKSPWQKRLSKETLRNFIDTLRS